MATAQVLAFQRFDLNGDGVLDQSELALAQAMLLRQLAQAAATTSTLQTTPLVSSTSTGTTTSSQSGSMSGGCSSAARGFVTADGLAKSPGHPFYRKLDELLAEAGFDRWIEGRSQW